jgi:uncharacterized protein
MSLPEIEKKVAFLSRPEIYPTPTRRVETKETHMAWVFLTETHAYKLKKPVRYDFLDFSTLDARRQDCEEEVRLNRRLAPDVYLGTMPLTMRPEGTFSWMDWEKLLTGWSEYADCPMIGCLTGRSPIKP